MPVTPQSAIIKTRSGKHIDLLAPEAMISLIDIDDIGYALSKTNRFNGHTTRPYSVAEHCLRGVAYSLPENKLKFLMHDSPEYVLYDAYGPLKDTEIFSAYRVLEERWGNSVAIRFGIPVGGSKLIHETDKRMLMTELRDLMGRPPSSGDAFLPFEGVISQVAPSCDEIAEQFIAKFYELAKATVGAKK